MFHRVLSLSNRLTTQLRYCKCRDSNIRMTSPKQIKLWNPDQLEGCRIARFVIEAAYDRHRNPRTLPHHQFRRRPKLVGDGDDGHFQSIPMRVLLAAIVDQRRYT